MRLTLNNISKEIKRKTGVDAILVRGEGYFYFSSDDEEVGLKLAKADSTSVYVYTLGSFSLERWVEEFEFIWDGIEDIDDIPVNFSKPIKLSYKTL